MELNLSKTKIMIFNFTKDYQFTTNLKLSGNDIEVVDKCKLLGTIITSDLKWSENTKELVRKANARMRILHKVAQYNAPKDDLVQIYKIYIRSILEQSCQVWHSSLTEQDTEDLERVQKSAVKVILPFVSYIEAIDKLDLDTLADRRKALCLKFAQKCSESENTQHMFPLNKNSNGINLRKKEKYKVNFAKTSRYKNSSIPFMQRLLNNEQ